MKYFSFTCFLAAMVSVLSTGCTGPVPEVSVLRAPEGAKLPQAVLDKAGTLHLIYYTGSMSSGDLWHVTKMPGAKDWSSAERVNSEPYSVHGLGPIDGGQVAVGPDGRLHVTWFHKDPNRFYYARSNHAGGFHDQQTLSIKDEGGIESSPTVTVDDNSNVYVFWHADAVEEAQRRVYMAVSRENGVMFDLPRAVSPATAGACGCCGLRAVTDAEGVVYVSYRGAGDNIRRGMRLLTSTDQGRNFADRLVQPWEVGACPVATTTFAAGPDTTLVAWETEGQVYVTDVDRLDDPLSPPGDAKFRRKNATVATNSRGEVFLGWGDGPGWQSGGTLHWQLFDAGGRPLGDEGGVSEPIPARSVPTAVAREDGAFVVVF
ncbi:MAG TPA: hypothetical protein DIU48_02740 [Acidobacteria bacterium]|nr:hypothetical protein [Acidobacteriota bacterium]